MRPKAATSRLLRFSVLPSRLVDRLPQRWWAIGNMHFFPMTSKTWHFCVDEHGVRTIEVLGRTVAWGRAPFDYEAAQRDGAVLAAATAAADERRFGPVE